MQDRVHTITSMGSGAPREGGPESDRSGSGAPPGSVADEGRAHGVERAIDRALAIQRPIVVAHLRSIRRRVPDATPERLVRVLERRYLAAVTTGGAAVGATAVIPGVGTGVTLALSGVETAGFLEATALFAQSVAEVHGIPIDNPERARALVMTLMLGREGSDLVRQFAGQATGAGIARDAYWGELITNSLPKAVMGTVVDRLRSVFIKQFAVRGGAGIIGKAIPFGIGAAIGGIGNNVLGRRVLAQSRLAFGQAPAVLPFELEPGDRDTMLRATGARMSRAASAVGRAARAPFRRAIGAGRGRNGSEVVAEVDVDEVAADGNTARAENARADRADASDPDRRLE
ncbi:hypothetical protein [Agromyces sp. CCNWLW203]|uniref:hypothetical protein n=1 Tax=Agromyces sp. CCNWLW203 TaxID=3112842 RepID=UPI002F969056